MNHPSNNNMAQPEKLMGMYNIGRIIQDIKTAESLGTNRFMDCMHVL